MQQLILILITVNKFILCQQQIQQKVFYEDYYGENYRKFNDFFGVKFIISICLASSKITMKVKLIQ